MAVRADIRSPHAGGSPFPGAFFQMARHARPPRHVGLPPGDSPGSLCPMGNAKGPPHGGPFLWPAAYRTFWNATRVERVARFRSIPLPDGGPGQTLLKVQHGIRLFPAEASPSRSITNRMSDKIASRPSGQQPPRNGHAAGQLLCFLPASSASRPPPSLPVSLKYSPLYREG